MNLSPLLHTYVFLLNFCKLIGLLHLNSDSIISHLFFSLSSVMPPLSKRAAHTSRRETDEKPKGAILFPLYNKAFKLLADSDIHLFCLGAAAGRAGEERVIDEPAQTSFRAKDGSEKASVWVVKPAVYRRRVSRLSLTERWFTALCFSVQK